MMNIFESKKTTVAAFMGMFAVGIFFVSPAYSADCKANVISEAEVEDVKLVPASQAETSEGCGSVSISRGEVTEDALTAAAQAIEPAAGAVSNANSDYNE